MLSVFSQVFLLSGFLVICTQFVLKNDLELEACCHQNYLNHSFGKVMLFFPSSQVRAFTHGAMGRQIDPSWGGPISRSSQCSTTGVKKAVVCAILSVGWCI